jgi:hypothetical protein
MLETYGLEGFTCLKTCLKHPKKGLCILKHVENGLHALKHSRNGLRVFGHVSMHI